MNSLVTVDKNEQRSRSRFSVLGDREEAGDTHNGDNSSASTSGGSVVLLLPKDNVVRDVESSDEYIPIMVDNVPVYLSQSEGGSPLYIRQYPPSVEELLLETSTKPSPSFDGFSEASGSTFDGFSEASYCSNVTFEGFLEENREDSKTVDKVKVLAPVTSEEEDVTSNEGKASEATSSGDSTLTPPCKKPVNIDRPLTRKFRATSSSNSESTSDFEEPSRKLKINVTRLSGRVKTRSSSCDSTNINSDVEITPKKVMGKKLSPIPGKITTRSSSCNSKNKNSDIVVLSESPATLKRQISSEAIVSIKKLKPEEALENIYKTRKSKNQNVLQVEPQEEKAGDVSPRRTRRSVDKNEVPSSSNEVLPRRTRRNRGMTEEESKVIPKEEVIVDESLDYIGKLCSSVGCTISFLESMKVKRVSVYNGIVFELSEFAKKIAWERFHVVLWIQRLSGVKDGEPSAEDLDKIHTILKRRKALKVTLAGQKIGDAKLKAFDLTEFVLPSSFKKEEVEQRSQPVCDLQEKEHENQKNLRSKKRIESGKEDTSMKQQNFFNGSGEVDRNVNKSENRINFMNTYKKRSENKEQYRKKKLQDTKNRESEMEEINEKTQDSNKVKGKQRNGKEPASKKTGRDYSWKEMSEDDVKSENTNSSDDDYYPEDESQDECYQERSMRKQLQVTKCIQSAVVVKKEKDSESLIKTDGMQSPHYTSDSNVGTLGVSKSGRLRKPSARGIQSIEIKSLFMQNTTSSTQPSKSGTSQETAVEKLKSFYKMDVSKEGHGEQKVKRTFRYPKNPEMLFQGMYLNRYKRLLQNDNTVISFTYKDGHLVPKFKEIDYYLGDYCCEAGVTVDDINSEDTKDVDMTVGMVKELHDFYVSRGASKTSLALRLLQMSSVKIEDYTQLLSTVMSVNKAAKTDRLDFNQLQREFKFPKRQSFGTSVPKKKFGMKKRKGDIIKKSYLSVSSEKRRALLQVPEAIKRASYAGIKKRCDRLRETMTQAQDGSHGTDYDVSLDVEILRARLKISARNAGNEKPSASDIRKRVKQMQDGTFLKDVNMTLDNEMVRSRMKDGSLNAGIVKRKVGRPRKNIIQTPEEENYVPARRRMVTKEKEGLLKRRDMSCSVKELEDVGYEKRRVGRPRKKVVQATASGHTEDTNSDSEIVKTRGREGSITRGDIVYLYTQWLRNKMAVGSNVFVTDLLKDVEQLMAERKVQPIRIPAGTLMSSSVRLHDEYKQMLTVSKEDAMLYLEEDWLEDIQYLVSISGPSRRSTIEGDNGGSSMERTDIDESFTHPEKVSDSDYSEKSLVIDDSVMSDDSSTAGEEPIVKDELNLELKNKFNVIDKKFSVGKRASRPNAGSRLRALRDDSENVRKGKLKNHMESVGKRSGKKRLNISHSLEEYDLEDFSEVKMENCPQKPVRKQVARLNKNALRNIDVKDNQMYTEEDYDVEKIVDYQEVYDKHRGKYLKYKVRWLGFGAEDDSWVDEADLQCPELLDEYWTVEGIKKRRYSRKKTPLSNNLHAVSVQNHEQPELLENVQTKISTPCSLGGSDKENGGNIIEAMIQHASLESCSVPKPSKEAERYVTRRELLDLYDNWRQENQNVLMAGGSNTVNLEILVSRVKDLMTSRKIKHFQPGSILNACFMMTLMRARMKTEKALSIFLDSDCSEVLEMSHKQYLMTRHKYSTGGVHGRKNCTNKGITISSLQNDLQKMQCDLSAAMGYRSANRCVLGILEEEVDCLENILKASQESKPDIWMLLQQELDILKEDLSSLENKNGKGPNSMASNARKSCKPKRVSRLKSPICLTEFGSDRLREPVLQAGQELLKCGVPSQKIDRVIELVVNKISGQRLRARPAGVLSIAEEVGLVHT